MRYQYTLEAIIKKDSENSSEIELQAKRPNTSDATPKEFRYAYLDMYRTLRKVHLYFNLKFVDSMTDDYLEKMNIKAHAAKYVASMKIHAKTDMHHKTMRNNHVYYVRGGIELDVQSLKERLDKAGIKTYTKRK